MQIIRDGLCSTPLVTIAEFVEDKTANFVVQSCLRRLSFEMTLCAIATYDSKTKNDLLETVRMRSVDIQVYHLTDIIKMAN
jgi:hypothetical protein